MSASSPACCSIRRRSSRSAGVVCSWRARSTKLDDRRGDDRHERNGLQHNNRSDYPAYGVLRGDVAVADGGDRLQRTPKTYANIGELRRGEKPDQHTADDD